MTEDELRELIRETIIELLAPRRALVLFTGALLGFDAAAAGLEQVVADGIELDCVQTPSAERILDQDRIRAIGIGQASTDLVYDHEMLIVATLTANIAAKAAHGIADCLASNLFAEFIMAGRPVVAVRTASCPDSPEKRERFPRMPASYAARLRANLADLASYGVELTDAAALHRCVVATWHRRLSGPAPVMVAEPAGMPVTCPLSLISHQVVQTLPPGTQLRISPRARVTALAGDAAASRSIRIVRVQEV